MKYKIEENEGKKTPQLYNLLQDAWEFYSMESLDIVEEKSYIEVPEGHQRP